MSDAPTSVSKVWVPKEELDTLFDGCKKKSYFADLLIGDFYRQDYMISEYSKLLLKEVYCLIEGNIPYLRESAENQTMVKDGRDGYLLGQEELSSLTTLALTLKKISFELEGQNLILDIQ